MFFFDLLGLFITGLQKQVAILHHLIYIIGDTERQNNGTYDQ